MTLAVQLARMIVLEAVRSRLAWVVLLVGVAAFGAAQFLSQVALTEAAEIRAALVAALLRSAAVFLVATFVITSMVREANDKVAELLLSQPFPRWKYMAAKLTGYALVSFLIAAGFALPLFALAPAANVMAWALSLACELLIVTAVSLFCVISLAQVLPALAATAGFYLLARSIEAMQIIATGPLSASDSWVDAAIKTVVTVIALLMPALDRFAVSGWLIDSGPGGAELGRVLSQTCIYLALIGAASLFDLYRKEY
jgi:hypothetical protein